MLKTEIVDTSFNCQNKIISIKNLMHIYKYILTIFSLTRFSFSLVLFFFVFFLVFFVLFCFLTSLLEKWEKIRKNFQKEEEKAFSSIILERGTEIFMIQNQRIEKLITMNYFYPKYVIFIFKKLKNFLQLAFTYLKSTVKT